MVETGLVPVARLLSQVQARLLTELVAVGVAVPVAEFAPMEIAAALTWTRQNATAQLDLARAIVLRLPAVHAALGRGDIDPPKARGIVDGVSSLDDLSARMVCAEILPLAPGLTTGQLRARLSKLVIVVDPDAASKRHHDRVNARRVVLQPEPDSTASIFGLDLPADRAAVAAQHVSDLARAAKRAGDVRTMDQLRADAFLDLLCGMPAGAASGGGVELVASLATLAELAEHPGELAGYGPVIADIARQVAAQQKATTWSYRIHDQNTGETFHGLTRRRPESLPCGQPSPTSAHHRPDRQAAGPRQASEARARRPSAGLVRHIRSRDRTCRAPGCRAPARHTDVDHTVAYEDGGATTAANLGLLCRFHHRAKHEGGWLLFQIAPGHFVWQSPLGETYYIQPESPP